MRARILSAAKALARRWPGVAAVVHRELDAVAQALRDPRLDELARLIDDGRFVEACALLAALSEDLGPGHQDLVGAVWEFNMAEQGAAPSPWAAALTRYADVLDAMQMKRRAHHLRSAVGVDPPRDEASARCILDVVLAPDWAAKRVMQEARGERPVEPVWVCPDKTCDNTWEYGSVGRCDCGTAFVKVDWLVEADVPENPSGDAGVSSRFDVVATVAGPSGEPWTEVATFEGPEAETMAHALADSLPAVVDVTVAMSPRAPLEIRGAPRVGSIADDAATWDETPSALDRRIGDAIVNIQPSKPSRVLPGQVWRCVGIDGELEVLTVHDEPTAGFQRVRLEPGPVMATDKGMTGLREWSFVRGPR